MCGFVPAAETSLFFFFSFFLCTCDGGGYHWEAGGRGGGGGWACPCTYIGAWPCVCVCSRAWTWSSCKGTCCSAGYCDVTLPPLHSCFHTSVTHPCLPLSPPPRSPLQLPFLLVACAQKCVFLKLTSIGAAASLKTLSVDSSALQSGLTRLSVLQRSFLEIKCDVNPLRDHPLYPPTPLFFTMQL